MNSKYGRHFALLHIFAGCRCWLMPECRENVAYRHLPLPIIHFPLPTNPLNLEPQTLNPFPVANFCPGNRLRDLLRLYR